jgi:hypothetical protein
MYEAKGTVTALTRKNEKNAKKLPIRAMKERLSVAGSFVTIFPDRRCLIVWSWTYSAVIERRKSAD